MVHSCERDSSAFLPSHVAIEPITKGLLSASLDSPVAIDAACSHSRGAVTGVCTQLTSVFIIAVADVCVKKPP